MEQRSRPTSQSLPTTNHNSPTHTSQVPLLNLAVAQKQYALVKSKSMPGTSRELPAPTKFTFSSHDVSTMSKMTDNTSQIPHWREFPKPPIRILCRVELKAKLKLDTYKSTSHSQEYHHKSSSYPTKPISVFEPSPEQQYIQQYYEYDSQDDESDEEWESSDEEEEEEDDDAENYGYSYHAPIQPSQQQPSSKHFTFPMQHQQPQQPSHQQYIPRTQYDYQKSNTMRPQQQSYPQPQQHPSQQQRLSIQHVEEKKRMIQRSSMKSIPIKQSSQPANNQVVFTIHPQQHKYSQPDMKRGSFSQSTQQHPQHQRSSSAHQMEIRRHRSAPSIPSQTPPKPIVYQPQQQQQQTNAYDVARNLWRKQRRSYQDMLSTLQTKLHVSAGSYPQQSFVSP